MIRRIEDVSVMRTIAGIVLLSLMAAGCSSSSRLFGSSSSPQSTASTPDLGDRIANFFSTGGSRKPQQQPGEPPPAEDIDCPEITVRDGASTLAVHAPGQPPTALNLRYQGTIGRTARECKVVAKMVQMRIGIEGRIILGPLGGPGTIEAPLRLAVVREGVKPETILTKTYRVPVSIESGASNVPFVHIDEDVTFPFVSAAALEKYVVYVGYDPEASKKKPEPRRRRKSAPKLRH
jgi:hypothetical protein